MGFLDQKITQAEIAARGVQSRPNKLTGTAQQNKLVFDALVTEVVRQKVNGLIDELLSAGAAAQLGVDTVTGIYADNVQDALEGIVKSMQDMTQGSVSDGSISRDKLGEQSVTTEKLAPGAVRESVLADGAVTARKIAPGAVTTEKIALLAITAALLADGAVTTPKIADQAVTAAKITNACIDNTKLAAGAVTAVKLQDGAVTTVKLQDGAVTAGKIAPGAVTAEKIAPGAVTCETVGLAPEQVRFIRAGTEEPTAETLGEGEIYLLYSEE